MPLAELTFVIYSTTSCFTPLQHALLHYIMLYSTTFGLYSTTTCFTPLLSCFTPLHHALLHCFHALLDYFWALLHNFHALLHYFHALLHCLMNDAVCGPKVVLCLFFFLIQKCVEKCWKHPNLFWQSLIALKKCCVCDLFLFFISVEQNYWDIGRYDVLRFYTYITNTYWYLNIILWYYIISYCISSFLLSISGVF